MSTNDFLIALMDKIKTLGNVYYEEAPKNAIFPFGVIPTISLRPLDYGYECNFDVEMYVSELEGETDVEVLCDTIRKELDGYSYSNSLGGFHIGFINQILSKQKEPDFTYRRITFKARIF